jgi:hypothetical protein
VTKEDTYRQKALELRRRGRLERNVSARMDWELLALGYDRLADMAERNAQNNIVYEYDPQAIEARRRRRRRYSPAQQLQQQQTLKRIR